MGTVYLLHFTRRLRHAGHYLGYVQGESWQALLDRFKTHQAGHGSRLVEVIVNQGIGVLMVKIWRNVDRGFERRLKRRKESPRLCPLCRRAGN